MAVARVLCALALAAALAACSKSAPPPPPAPPAPENVFTAPADRELVKGALKDIAANPAVHGARQFSGMTISDDPKGTFRAVCGQAVASSGTTKDFVAIAQPGPAIAFVSVRNDTLTPTQIATCRPLVLKYLGERTRIDIAEKAFADAGCSSFDPSYWWSWKAYCRGDITQPSAPPPAQ